MVVLFALKIFIAVWRLALRASRRFSVRTLRILTAYSVALFILSCWGLHLYEDAQQKLRHELSPEIISISACIVYSFPPYLHELVVESGDPDWAEEFSAAGYVMISAHMVAPAELYALRRQTFDPLDLGRHFRREMTNFVQVSAPERTDFKHTILFWLSLIGMIVSPISTVITLGFTWITLHRRRAEELLMRLEMEKYRLEIEQLRLDLERARREHEESDAASPRIILLS